jgi:hypothetical protein
MQEHGLRRAMRNATATAVIQGHLGQTGSHPSSCDALRMGLLRSCTWFPLSDQEGNPPRPYNQTGLCCDTLTLPWGIYRWLLPRGARAPRCTSSSLGNVRHISFAPEGNVTAENQHPTTPHSCPQQHQTSTQAES